MKPWLEGTGGAAGCWSELSRNHSWNRSLLKQACVSCCCCHWQELLPLRLHRGGLRWCVAPQPQEEPNKLLHAHFRPVVLFKVLFWYITVKKKKKKAACTIAPLLLLLPPTALLGDCLVPSAPTGTQRCVKL